MSDRLTRRQSVHLLNRAGFAATPEEIEWAMARPSAETVDRLLDFPNTAAGESDPADVPDMSMLRDYPSGFSDLAAMFDGVGEREAREMRGKMIEANRAALHNVIAWWLKRMADGRHPLHEKLTLFWHGHFTTSSYDVWSTRMLWEQNELLRRHAGGSFADLLAGICRDPAMLDYLDNSSNQSRAPNENFARELMELFTLGIGQYSEEEVREVARAFTGWTHDGERFSFRAEIHDGGRKTVFGQSGDFDGTDVQRLILLHPSCAKFVARKLFNFFIGVEATPRLYETLGEGFARSNFDIRRLVRTILRSRAFFDDQVIGTQIKSPIQLLIGTIRLLRIPLPDTDAMREHLAAMGQVPFLPPDVKGWPSGHGWINTTRLFCRHNAAIWLAGLSTSGISPGNKPWSQLVDHWCDLLLCQSPATQRRQILLDLPHDPNDPDGSQRRLLELIVTLPEFQLA